MYVHEGFDDAKTKATQVLFQDQENKDQEES